MNNDGVTNPKKLRDSERGKKSWHRPVADREKYDKNFGDIDWGKKITKDTEK